MITFPANVVKQNYGSNIKSITLNSTEFPSMWNSTGAMNYSHLVFYDGVPEKFSWAEI